MNLFRVRGIQLAVHFSFVLLLLINAFDGWADSGWAGMWWSSATLVAFFVCVVLHELGHSFTAMHYGIGVRRILLMPIGGMAEFDGIPRQPRRELLITIAGPAVNFAIAAVLWLMLPAGSVDDAEPASFTLALVDFGHGLRQWNLAMGLFNLLPAFPMDGGRILRALLATRLNYVRATFWAATTGKVLCVMAAIAALAFAPLSSAGLMVALFAFIFLVGEMEYRMAKRREIEDAHLRATMMRFYATSPHAVEPPVLIGTLAAEPRVEDELPGPRPPVSNLPS
jgi:Zn-dependent protease